MHTKPMSELNGEFTKTEPEKYTCHKCQKQEAICKVWESSCGGYEDYKYICKACGYIWWVDGIDS